MILAAGLTPAWQQILCFDDVQPGRSEPRSEVHWCASGKVLNVGMALGAAWRPSRQTLSPSAARPGRLHRAGVRRVRQSVHAGSRARRRRRVCTTHDRRGNVRRRPSWSRTGTATARAQRHSLRRLLRRGRVPGRRGRLNGLASRRHAGDDLSRPAGAGARPSGARRPRAGAARRPSNAGRAW